MLGMLRRRKLAEFAEIRCRDGAFTPEQARRYLSRARELGFGLKLNAGPRSNPGAIEVAVGMGAASVGQVAEAAERDALLLASSATIATLLPGAVLHGGTERPRRRAF